MGGLSLVLNRHSGGQTGRRRARAPIRYQKPAACRRSLRVNLAGSSAGIVNTRIVLQPPRERLGNTLQQRRPLISRSFEQLLGGKINVLGDLSECLGMCLSGLAVIRIMPDTADPRIGSGPD